VEDAALGYSSVDRGKVCEVRVDFYDEVAIRYDLRVRSSLRVSDRLRLYKRPLCLSCKCLRDVEEGCRSVLFVIEGVVDRTENTADCTRSVLTVAMEGQEVVKGNSFSYTHSVDPLGIWQFLVCAWWFQFNFPGGRN
jgi:hypothetical protein